MHTYYDNIVRHVCAYLEFINANSNEQTDPEAGKIEDPLSQDKSHREEEVGRRKERKDKEGKGKQRQLLFSWRLMLEVVSILEL